MKAILRDLLISRDGTQVVSFQLNKCEDFRAAYDTLINKDLDLDVKEHKEKRSLNANAYAWVLINEIANVMRLSKEECYLMMLKDYGQTEIVSTTSDDLNGYAKYYELLGESELNGKVFKHFRVFKRSSEFDTKEMAIFIDGIIQEAKQLGIETMTPNQILEIEAAWRNNER